MRGTVFRVGLPLVQQADRPGPDQPARSTLPLRGRVALVVENDQGMQRGYEMILRDRLGMVQPTEVGYLLPASIEVPDAEPVRVEAATAPAPEPVVDATSAEQAEVDGAVASDGDDDTAADADAEAHTDTDTASTDPDPSQGGRDG